ncbi:glycosyltransferase family 2 protein [Rhodospirillum sp. A1_3_36]|uniref:glycosyltransferase family 2 protein n=1 Tax=Rhodospirillum sp. A1_3_36 TaxID=3391666 RepID=UPI0039A6DBAE
MTAPPSVSVVMPAYNVAAFIEESIGSVLAQTWSDFELVVVDDGSSDNSAALAEAIDDPRISVIRQVNRGLAGARNTGIRAARAPIIAFLDSDDLWMPRKLEAHMAHLAAHPAVGVSFDPSRIIDDAGHPLGLVQTPKRRDISPLDVFTRNPVGNGSAPVIRRTCLDSIALLPAPGEPGADRLCWFDESFRQSEDIECWMRIALTTDWRFQGLDEALTWYRISESGLSANVERQFESWRRMAAKVAALDPEFYLDHGRLAEAYQLRYLARRAVRSRDGRKALSLVTRAIRTAPAILWKEPLRSLVTLGAAIVLRGTPLVLYRSLERLALSLNQIRTRGGTA